MNPEQQISNARALMGQINALAEIGFDLAERMVTAEGREALVKELGPAALELLNGASPQAVAIGFVTRSGGTNLQTALSDGDYDDSVNEVSEDRLESRPRDPQDFDRTLNSQQVSRSSVIKMPSNLPLNSPAIMGVVAGAKLFTDALRDMNEVAEIETTKRTQILAERDETIARIDATRRAMELYLNRTFDERRDNFSKLFDVLDRAQGNNDTTGMQMALSGILELVKTSPFKDFDSFKKSFDDPEHVWEL